VQGETEIELFVDGAAVRRTDTGLPRDYDDTVDVLAAVASKTWPD